MCRFHVRDNVNRNVLNFNPFLLRILSTFGLVRSMCLRFYQILGILCQQMKLTPLLRQGNSKMKRKYRIDSIVTKFFFSSFGSFSRNRKLFDRFKRNLFSGSGQSAINCVRCQRVKTAKRMNNFVKSKIYCFLSMFVPHTNTHTRGNRNRRKSTTFSVSLLRFEMKSFVFICRCHFERRQNLHAKREMTSTNNSARNLFILLSIFDCLSFISSA